MKTIFFLSAAVLLSSCAASYKPIMPKSLNYQSNSSVFNDLEFSYRYDVLNEKGNKKYTKKEHSKNIKVVAIRIVNNSNTDYIFGRDLTLKTNSGGNITLLQPEMIKNQLKQNVPIYLLYLLLTPLTLNTENSVTPIGLVVGPGITAGNMIIASTANSNLEFELQQHNLIDKPIKAGETVYGLVGVVDLGYNPLELVEID